MRINMSDPNAPGRFQMPGGGVIRLRPMSASVLEGLNKQHMKTETEYRRGQRFEKRVVKDQDAYDQDFWDYIIVGWDGLEDEHGNPIQDTPENKVFLQKHSPEFSGMVQDFLEELQARRKEEAEALEKNSLTTSAVS